MEKSKKFIVKDETLTDMIKVIRVGNKSRQNEILDIFIKNKVNPFKSSMYLVEYIMRDVPDFKLKAFFTSTYINRALAIKRINDFYNDNIESLLSLKLTLVE